ncbi:hypothetical protein O181_058533 [Austropuccinia psidii MF-1]|uniref:Uncharacterized protein n=1 Tax=Austropuccinia psidii MF-1 TaxID=1389203 RepID=A0A9Q3EH29_9BASI|nr:hypothetical protein [Austropuccinia psidii MF-1]
MTIEKLPLDRFLVKNSGDAILTGNFLSRIMKVLHQSVKAFLLEGNLWHKRLGNPVNQALKMVGITPSLDTWEVFLTGKSSLLPFSENRDKAQHSFEYIHLDVVGSIDPI